ncbi:MAG TPA: hypothetical protein VD761_08190 [Solirubrobacterales bacterium]|nr:hypothetical protein [Solirubrobacterales bacterium]
MAAQGLEAVRREAVRAGVVRPEAEVRLAGVRGSVRQGVEQPTGAGC